jgi:hypothetical protein
MVKNKQTTLVKSSKPSGSLLFITLSILLFNLVHLQIQAQPISTYFFGQNAYMPDYIGTTHYYGTLDSHWQEVKDSRCVSVRIGGNQYDKDNAHGGPPTTAQLVALINNIQVNGGEPIVQIDYADGSFTSTDAANTVTAINITNLGSIQRKVKYWIIGNEPDLGYTTNNTSALIASYIKTFSTAMKGVSGQSDIKIIAPEFSYYYAPNPTSPMITSLLTHGGGNDITGLVTGQSYYYVDYISFHYYGFDGTQTTAAQVISQITSTNQLSDMLGHLSGLLTTANGYRSASPLQMAVTEGNINYQNPAVADSALSQVSANSFIAGQFWAEMMATCMKNSVQFMNFWSVIEGNDGTFWVSNKGYLRGVNAGKRSTWYHFKILAENFNGTFVSATIASPNSDFKAFGSYNPTQIAVMVMNQNASSYNYSLNLNNSATLGSYAKKIHFSTGINIASKTYDRTIGANTT